MITKWDRRFIDLACLVASWSRDESTKCGCVIADVKNRIISVGFNGFARGVLDLPERYADRETKYRLVLHSEVNAVLFSGRDIAGCTAYVVPMPPCSRCAAVLVQSGITRVVTVELPADKAERWGDDVLLTMKQFREAEVACELIDDTGPAASRMHEDTR
jgi:dCMP deaminase